MGIVKQLKTVNRFRGGLKGSAAPLCVVFMLYLQNLIVKSPFESLDIHGLEFCNIIIIIQWNLNITNLSTTKSLV